MYGAQTGAIVAVDMLKLRTTKDVSQEESKLHSKEIRNLFAEKLEQPAGAT